ncbi:hypothetical protein [Janthinobacterium sp. SUN137]|uniref:hypothetical protein n=1 Tax=Janthinobacterium sp. SUN137 TaxID=3014789 RepID=UPI002712CA59|nr:hypothetical protein [Janthinobacterium sp. SUN137]MDO8040369.1 hypothetical protein [Janthinobacterium sp. SUN137]
MIFKNYERTDSSPKANAEGSFAFLDRSARPEFEVVRNFVEELLAQYPAKGIDEVVARLTRGNEVDFRSASFEVLIFNYLRRLGYTLEPHPELKNGSKKQPDFHVVAPDGSEFLLEAVLSKEDKGENPAVKAMIGTVMDKLNTRPHDNFRVTFSTRGVPTTQPSGKKILHEVHTWLNTLDPDQIQAEHHASFFATAPKRDIPHEDWTVSFQPIPIPPEKRGTAKQLIGLIDGGGGVVDSWTPLRESLKEKGQRYGELEHPLLVAVNFSAFNLSDIDEMQALFGQEQFHFPIEGDGEPDFSRAKNGLWIGPKGPRATRVSGAWFFNDLSFHTAARRKGTLYFNPWALHALPAILDQFPHARVGADMKIERGGEVTFADVFKLSSDWPD